MVLRTLGWIFLGLVLGLGVMGAYNARLDLYGVFSSGYRLFYEDMAPNYHYLKTRYVLEDPARFNCLVMGSSRVSGIDADRLGERCYNMTHSGGTPVQHLHDLELFVRGGVELDVIYLGVDDLAYTWDNDSNDTHYRRRAYPATPWEWLGFYSMYLFRWFEAEDFEILGGRRSRIDMPYWILTEGADGTPGSREDAEDIYSQPERQRAEIAKMNPTIWFREDRIDETLRALEGILRIAEDNGIELRLFFNPMHYKTYLANDWEMMYRFKNGLAELSTYRDFSGFNRVTVDDRFWIETSHYSLLAGDQMITAMTGDPAVPDLLGREQTPEGVRASYVEDLEQALQLVPELVGEQSGLFLPAPVADAMLEGIEPEDLLAPPGISAGKGLIVSEGQAGLELFSRTRDPQVRFNNQPLAEGQNNLLVLDFSVPLPGYAEVYHAGPDGKFSRKNRILYRTGEGRNKLVVPVPTERAVGRLRLDPGRDAGVYRLHAAQLYRLPPVEEP